MKLVELTKVYSGNYLTFYIAKYILNDGTIKHYEFTSRYNDLSIDTFGKTNPSGVGIIAFSKDKQMILLQKEFRLACNKYVYNFPAGLIDDNEDPILASKRELREETGLEIRSIEKILYPSFVNQGTTDESMYVVICQAEGDIKPSCFVDEEIVASWYTKKEAKKILEDECAISIRTQIFLYNWINQK